MIAKLIGRILTIPRVRDKLYQIAQRTPDTHITSAKDPNDVYMYRYWLFNPITNYKRKYRLIPFSIRIHHIVRPDEDRHMHDHPFNARTWIMRGGYDEVRLEQLEVYGERFDEQFYDATELGDTEYIEGNFYAHITYSRKPGDSTTLGYRRFHRITKLHGGEALTFFMFGAYKGKWGFLVDGVKVPYREYERRFKEAQ